MKLSVYSVYDKKANCYLRTFTYFVSHDGESLRIFGDMVSDVKLPLVRHPEDYALYKLSDFDDVSGVFSPLSAPKFMSHAIDFINEKEVR